MTWINILCSREEGQNPIFACTYYLDVPQEDFAHTPDNQRVIQFYSPVDFKTLRVDCPNARAIYRQCVEIYRGIKLYAKVVKLGISKIANYNSSWIHYSTNAKNIVAHFWNSMS